MTLNKTILQSLVSGNHFKDRANDTGILTEGKCIINQDLDNAIWKIDVRLLERSKYVLAPDEMERAFSRNEATRRKEKRLKEIEDVVSADKIFLESKTGQNFFTLINKNIEILTSLKKDVNLYFIHEIGKWPEVIRDTRSVHRPEFKDFEIGVGVSSNNVLATGELKNSCGLIWSLHNASSGPNPISGTGVFKSGEATAKRGTSDFILPVPQVGCNIALEVDMRPDRKSAIFMVGSVKIPFFISFLPQDVKFTISLSHAELELVSLKKLTTPSIEIPFGAEPKLFA